jgi:hypothetical protein
MPKKKAKKGEAPYWSKYFACKTLQTLIPLTMCGEPTKVRSAKWFHQNCPTLPSIFSSFTKTTMAIIFFPPLVFKYEEGEIAITSNDPLLELAKFYNYEGFS